MPAFGRVAKLTGTSGQEYDQVGGRAEWICDHGPIPERERRLGLIADLDKQRRLGERLRAVKRGQSP